MRLGNYNDTRTVLAPGSSDIRRATVRVASMALLAFMAAFLLACGDGGGSVAQDDATAVVDTIPFIDGESLTYELRNDDGVVGYGTLSVASEGDHFVLSQDYEEAAVPEGEKPTADHATVSVDQTSLRPLSVDRVVERRKKADEYHGQYAPDGTVVTVTTSDDSKERELEVPTPSYENESSLWLWRTLPLAEDYTSRYVSVNTIERKSQTVELQVTGQQRITVPAGTYETWRLQVRNGRATRVAWINIEAPHEIVQWDNGDTVFLLAPPR